MRHIHIKSGRAMLAAEVHGHGVPIVFLHARVADRRMWIHQARQVGAEHQAIAYERLKDVSVPTLVICGDLDLPAIQERSRYVAQTVPNGKFIQISGAAHLPSLEQPQEVTNLIIEFIDSFITES